MPAMKNTLTLLLLFVFLTAQSQDSIKKWKFNFQLDNRFSSIRKNDLVIFGAKLGMQYKNKIRFGIGASSILNEVDISYTNRKTNLSEENKINFWYFSMYIDWIVYKKGNWECFVTEQLGFGKPKFIKEINNDIVSDLNVNLYINEISGQANYKINSWAGIGMGVGYRNLINAKPQLNTTFNAPIYIVKVIIFPETFFKN